MGDPLERVFWMFFFLVFFPSLPCFFMTGIATAFAHMEGGPSRH